jgi:toxin-antitoxin system PIN domain toxin
VKYLLDINVLIAAGHTGHVHHHRAIAWIHAVRNKAESFCTCAITELGFVRVSVQSGLQYDVAAARKALASMKASSPVRFELLPDRLGAESLPAFAKSPDRLTDGHLLALAEASGAELVTLDKGIPGALLLT